MNKKHFLFVIPLIALIAIGFLSGSAFSGPSGHYGIGGSAYDCNICHDFLNGVYGGGGVYGDPPPPPSSGYNLRWIKSPIVYPSVTSPDVEFLSFSGLAKGAYPFNGPCEVCHTTTKYYRNNSPGLSHYTGNCMPCHPHFRSDIGDYFEPSFKGNQSHYTHFTDPKGPMLGTSSCTYNLGGCHNPNDYSKFGPDPGQVLEDTTVCDNCHSPSGVFPGAGGLKDPIIGAKANWTDGIYEPVTSGFPYLLKAGKENWCATCHDNAPASSNRDGTGVKAPNVMGNSSQTYGYYVNGHGVEGYVCDACHDFAVTHIDGNARTYSASASPNNYRSGYRLNADLAVPRNGQVYPAAFRLCINCHEYSEITGGTSNFRNDLSGLQFHLMHLNWWPAFYAADTDFNGTIDSAITCISCHNVHGANGNAVMIRHGELISTPGTTDKVPALDFHWYKGDSVTQTTVLEESLYGGLLCGLLSDVSYNHVCAGCHQTGQLKWYRTPGGPLGVTVEAVWTEGFDGNNWFSKKDFAVNEQIRYHVRFTVIGSAPTYFLKSPGNVSKAVNTLGTAWTTKLPKSDTLAPDTYEWTWKEAIPSNATPGTDAAKVTIKIVMRDVPGGTVLSSNKQSFTFNILP
jgi:hypothetical protein